ncbi:DUF3237 domain-containing protein [Nonomuraea sp. NPDC004354]
MFDEPVRPGLEPLARFRVELAAVKDLGETPWGHRRVIDVLGGSFDGPRMAGTVLPGGADWQVVHGDGSATIDARYTLRTHDGALICILTSGVRHGPPEVIAALGRGEPVDPADYYFRLAVRFETAAPGYLWLNHTLAVASGLRAATAVHYDAYALR